MWTGFTCGSKYKVNERSAKKKKNILYRLNDLRGRLFFSSDKWNSISAQIRVHKREVNHYPIWAYSFMFLQAAREWNLVRRACFNCLTQKGRGAFVRANKAWSCQTSEYCGRPHRPSAQKILRSLYFLFASLNARSSELQGSLRLFRWV